MTKFVNDIHGKPGDCVELENLDIPGLDSFTEYKGIYFTFQPNLNSPIPGAGRWVITDNITNPKVANIAWFDDAYTRLDQAIEKFKALINDK